MPLLEQILSMHTPRPLPPSEFKVVWSGALERQGHCPSLLDWTSDGRNLHGHDSLHAAGMIPLVNRMTRER